MAVAHPSSVLGAHRAAPSSKARSVEAAEVASNGAAEAVVVSGAAAVGAAAGDEGE
jgi:hypothetical protein